MTDSRRRLESVRDSVTHRFSVDNHKGYLTVGLYPDGTPGEVFIRIAKQGSTLGGVMDSFAIAVSMALQYGVPLSALVAKFSNVHFEPAGATQNKEIPFARSIVDYVFKWMGKRFLKEEPTNGPIS